jgi:uncharacterized membrane protein
MSTAPTPIPASGRRSSATYFFLRGVAITLPPVLTLLILLWVANGFNTYLIQPINLVVRYAMATAKNDIRTRDQLRPRPAKFPPIPEWQRNYLVTAKLEEDWAGGAIPADLLLSDEWNREVYVPMGNGMDPGQFVPLADYELVFKHVRPQPPPTTAIGLYMEVAAVRDYVKLWQYSAAALSMLIIAMYFLGRFVTARIGKWFVHKIEAVLVRVPLVRNVYSTVKQVTDFVLSDREVEFQRVVALEYPRAGSWTLGFVTGEGMLDCAAEVREPMLTVLVPTSPVPAGGFTVMVTRSSVIDLNLTVDQAVQFVVSCGVLVPPQQQATAEALEQELQKRLGAPELTASTAAGGERGDSTP